VSDFEAPGVLADDDVDALPGPDVAADEPHPHSDTSVNSTISDVRLARDTRRKEGDVVTVAPGVAAA
jgi:hypothetical protein